MSEAGCLPILDDASWDPRNAESWAWLRHSRRSIERSAGVSKPWSAPTDLPGRGSPLNMRLNDGQL